MSHPPRHGMILLIVLVVIALCSLAAVTFSELMLAEREAVNAAVHKVQARALADSGLEMARMFVGMTPDEQISAGGTYDNPERFRGVLVLDGASPQDRGRFTIVAPLVEDGAFQGIRFGLEDESTKLNLNILPALDQKLPGSGRQILMGLPGMTADVADAILDWMDQDDEPREFGAELETYQMLSPPYVPVNGPLSTIEDLLLVRGVTPSLLFGVDANRNGVADQGEPSPMSLPDVDNSDRSMDRGWAAYLTLYSMEANVQPDGVTPRINLNQSDMQQLYSDLEAALGKEWASFIVAYKQYYSPPSGQTMMQRQKTPPSSLVRLSQGMPGGAMALHPASVLFGVLAQQPGGGSGRGSGGGTGGSAPGGGSSPGTSPGQPTPPAPSGPTTGASKTGATVSAASIKLDLTQPGKVTLTSVLDLVGAKVQVPSSLLGSPGPSQNVTLECPFPYDPASPAMVDAYLPKLLDYVTATSNKLIPGRININQAPRVVLQGIPGMTPEMVDQIISQRQPDPAQRDPAQRHETWILSQGIVTLEEMKLLSPFITGGGCVYRAQVVGYYDGEGPSARIEAVIHAGTRPPRVIFWRDMSHLGRGYPREVLGVETFGGE